jgi:hypothetical protein
LKSKDSLQGRRWSESLVRVVGIQLVSLELFHGGSKLVQFELSLYALELLMDVNGTVDNHYLISIIVCLAGNFIRKYLIAFHPIGKSLLRIVTFTQNGKYPRTLAVMMQLKFRSWDHEHNIFGFD